MKFTVSSADLQKALARIGGVLPSKTTMPILENILFELKGNELTLTASDMHIYSTVTLNVSGSADGMIVIPAKRLTDTVRSLPEVPVTFSIDVATNRTTISTENGTYSLTSESAKDYPQIPVFKETSKFTIDAAALRVLIYRTVFAVSTDELRQAMMGILLQAQDDGLRAVATDGHRLTRTTLKGLKGKGLQKDIIVPAKAMGQVLKVMDGGSCTISVSDSHIRFAYGSSTLVSVLIDEPYPPYESVIPKDNEKTMKVGREALIAAIRRVGLYASATTHQVRLDVDTNALTISAQDADFGSDARESVPCTYEADHLEIGFNATYLTDLLTHLDGDDVVFKFSSAIRAGIVMPAAENDQEDVIMLIMPVRLTT